ncbi:MAG: RNA polymerase sigma factor [Saprospiraceae bacterium]
MKNNEKYLIQECLKGTQSAFKTIYEKYQAYVYTICIRYGVSPIEVKDTMQIIFMEIFKSLKNYDSSKSQFKTWLSRIAINQILMQKRKARIDYTNLENEKINLIESNFTIPIEAKIDEEILYGILSKMPVKYISVFNLFIIDGYSHQEIAKALNISEGTSRVLLHRGRFWAMKQIRIHFEDAIPNLKKAL